MTRLVVAKYIVLHSKECKTAAINGGPLRIHLFSLIILIMTDFVVPGQPITSEVGYLRGHGAYIKSTDADSDGKNSGQLISSVAGRMERINKLITVKALRSRYCGEVGDLIVGRITTVDSKRWKVDVNGVRDAVLPLSSINLASGEQRMKTYEDQLSMRTLFQEEDLICAEIQNISAEGVISLHSRSLKYGKLENGQLIIVPSALVRRLPQHYISLPNGIDVILGKNGHIWITRSIPESWKQESEDLRDDLAPLAETLQRLRVKHAETPLTLEERVKVVRTRNAIAAISRSAELKSQENSSSNSSSSSSSGVSGALTVSPETIMAVYQRSLELRMEPKDMIQAQCSLALVVGIKE